MLSWVYFRAADSDTNPRYPFGLATHSGVDGHLLGVEVKLVDFRRVWGKSAKRVSRMSSVAVQQRVRYERKRSQSFIHAEFEAFFFVKFVVVC